MYYLSIVLFLISVFQNYVSGYSIALTSNAPIVQGATVNFTAVLTDRGNIPEGYFKWSWEDNALDGHTQEVKSYSPVSTWNVSYPRKNAPGPYVVQVEVYMWNFIYWSFLTSERHRFTISAMLNGNMNLTQDKISRNDYVSNTQELVHKVILSQPDSDYINERATSILTYWFVNCTYYSFTNDFQFIMNYTQPDAVYEIEALVVASFEPIPTTTMVPSTTSSTTTTSTTTTIKTTSVSPPSTTTLKSNITSNVDKKSVVKRELIENTSPVFGNITVPFVCLNKSVVPPDPKKIYGYFHHKITVKAPVSNVSVTGNNWLQQGDMLNLNVKCSGSPPYNYCYIYLKGLHNITGNETCSQMMSKSACLLEMARYLPDPLEYTILIILENEVSKIISPVTVTVYKAIHHAQLSVIVVPVSFSLVAAVLIVFGIAYYIQSRRMFTVEVADFDFGQQYADLEYKTFRERLHDSIINAFGRVPPLSDQETPEWTPDNSPTNGLKYGSMT